MLDLRRLQYFLTIAREQSLTRAARELGIAQPALSYHLTQIETAFGVKLVERHARGVVVTEAGAMLQAEAQRIIRAVKETEAKLLEQADVPTGEIVIGIASTLTGVFLSPLLKVATTDLPRVKVHLQEGTTQSLAHGLRENRIDLAISMSSVGSSSAQPLADEALCLISNRENAPGCAEISLADALELPLILSTPRHHVMRSIVDGAASRLGIEANVVLEIDGTFMTRSAILDGYGHTIMGRAFTEKDFSEGLCSTRIVNPTLYRRLILHRSDAVVNPIAMSRVSETIKTVAMQLIEDGVWEKIHTTGTMLDSR
ncbi:MAG: LysR family transcriptional regulator [Geminicoccaceae bacterium]|nr:LysR family transcriptional regulator [Geminicoccaceae bacterium]